MIQLQRFEESKDDLIDFTDGKNETLLRIYTRLSEIGKLSSKYEAAIRICMDLEPLKPGPNGRAFGVHPEELKSYQMRNPNQVSKRYYNSGNCFVFTRYKESSGAVPFSLFLEKLGFTKFTETNSVFISKSGIGNKPYCVDSTINNREIKPGFKPMLRYALLTPETPNSTKDAISELRNSYENRNGSYIKVLIASAVGGVGINDGNVGTIILLDSEWNESAMYT